MAASAPWWLPAMSAQHYQGLEPRLELFLECRILGRPPASAVKAEISGSTSEVWQARKRQFYDVSLLL